MAEPLSIDLGNALSAFWAFSMAFSGLFSASAIAASVRNTFEGVMTAPISAFAKLPFAASALRR
ncbi:MAG: hypothetical protein EAZ55_09080 [Cytophagales bacterium]|nr:MAG: hypothetical protein EAZ55_09080 [Cytophagales bacterium]